MPEPDRCDRCGSPFQYDNDRDLIIASCLKCDLGFDEGENKE